MIIQGLNEQTLRVYAMQKESTGPTPTIHSNAGMNKKEIIL